jgi:hypothetical protein
MLKHGRIVDPDAMQIAQPKSQLERSNRIESGLHQRLVQIHPFHWRTCDL